MTNHWEHYPHEADMGIRGVGQTIESAFEQAALALTAVMLDPAQVQTEESIHVQCQNNDLEILFLDWINAIIYEMACRKMLFSHYRVRIDQDKLSGELQGEKVDVKRHQPAVEIKGATFTTLQVRQLDNGDWMAQTVVDV